MRIAIACYPTHGGSGVVASELALGLAERGHEIHIASNAVPHAASVYLAREISGTSPTKIIRTLQMRSGMKIFGNGVDGPGVAV